MSSKHDYYRAVAQLRSDDGVLDQQMRFASSWVIRYDLPSLLLNRVVPFDPDQGVIDYARYRVVDLAMDVVERAGVAFRPFLAIWQALQVDPGDSGTWTWLVNNVNTYAGTARTCAEAARHWTFPSVLYRAAVVTSRCTLMELHASFADAQRYRSIYGSETVLAYLEGLVQRDRNSRFFVSQAQIL